MTWLATKTTAIVVSGAVSGSSFVTAAMSQPDVSAMAAGSAPRSTRPAHHTAARPGSARRRAAKNAHSWRARSRAITRRPSS